MSVPDAKFTKGEFEVSTPCTVPGGHLWEGEGKFAGRSGGIFRALNAVSSSTSSHHCFSVPISQMSKPRYGAAWLWGPGIWPWAIRGLDPPHPA